MKYFFYHGKCSDGFGAAYAARKWVAQCETQGVFHAINYGDQLPGMLGVVDDPVYFLDWCPEGPDLEKALKSNPAAKVVILDHHLSAKQKMEGEHREVWRRMQEEGKVTVNLDLERSGAMLAWYHFFGPGVPNLLLQYVEDRDLWKFSLPESRAVNEVIRAAGFDLAKWEALEVRLKEQFGAVVAEGRAVLEANEALIQRAADSSWTLSDWHGFAVVPVVNTSLFQSEVCHRLLRRHPEAQVAVCYYHDGKLYRFSVRSENGTAIRLASQFPGGGGHPNAAGFSTTTLPW